MTPEQHIGKVFRNKHGIEIRIIEIMDAPEGDRYVGEIAKYHEIKKDYFEKSLVFNIGELMRFEVESFDTLYTIVDFCGEKEEVL